MSKSEILDGKTLFVHMFPTSNVLNPQFSCLNDVFCTYFHDVRHISQVQMAGGPGHSHGATEKVLGSWADMAILLIILYIIVFCIIIYRYIYIYI